MKKSKIHSDVLFYDLGKGYVFEPEQEPEPHHFGAVLE
jgi:hypothetical protein